MRYNDPTFLENVVGMPQSHAHAFITTAHSQKCVIISRATGPTCHGLLAEGYDTKGYRIHGKSCNWGPMAGFVLRDPRLNKRGLEKAGFNRKKHDEAIKLDKENQGRKANTTPLVISENRRLWLIAKGLINVAKKSDRWDGTARHHTGIYFKYSLILVQAGLWGVYFDYTDASVKFRQERGSNIVNYTKKYGNRYEPMLALTNPIQYRQFNSDNYLNAITGDYDLFAIWPYVESYDPFGEDHRPLGTTKGFTGEQRKNIDRLEKNFTEMDSNGRRQGTKLGNITGRIYHVGQLINSIVGRQNVIWHSDESARPFLDDVDLPVIAFTPSGMQFGIETISDFKLFIGMCDSDGIHVSLSNAWVQNPTSEFPNRLGSGEGDKYLNKVPEDTFRRIVPRWYNG